MSDEVKIEESELEEVSGGQRHPYPPFPPKPFDIRDSEMYGQYNDQPNHPLGVPQKDWGNYTSYTIAAGDTLIGIAQRCGMTMDELIRINNIKDANWIVAGQNLWVLR